MRRIGIDLGTTNTCMYCASFPPVVEGDARDYFTLNPIKIFYENKGDMINPEIDSKMPSAIYARRKRDAETKEEYDFYLGKIAVITAKQDNAIEMINTKRLMCNEDADKIVKYGLTAQDIAQKLLEGCRYSILQSSDIGNRRLKLSTQCITQPAAFGLFASRGIHDAGKAAGFSNAEVQREPIAALLSYLYQELDDPDKAEKLLERQSRKGDKLLTLVVDIGGGTTDVTIQEINISGSAEHKQGSLFCTGYTINFMNLVSEDNSPAAAANQNPAFGGYEFDKRIASHIIDEWDKQYYKVKNEHLNLNDIEFKKQIEYLYQRVQNHKNSLSTNPTTKSDTVIINDVTITTQWSPENLYEWTRPLCISPDDQEENTQTIYGIIADTIRRSGYKVKDIDCFFVTGGMSSYKVVRDVINEKFGNIVENGVLCYSEDPLYDIAKGAAVCNCYFEVKMPDSVLYADLMIDDPCGEPYVLVKKNTPLPTSGSIKNFLTLRNPVYFHVDVLWGNGPKDCKLQKLRRLRKPVTSSNSSGKVTRLGTPISVEYEIDAHQAMNITLIVHDSQGEYQVPLLRLIEDIDLTTKGD